MFCEEHFMLVHAKLCVSVRERVFVIAVCVRASVYVNVCYLCM